MVKFLAVTAAVYVLLLSNIHMIDAITCPNDTEIVYLSAGARCCNRFKGRCSPGNEIIPCHEEGKPDTICSPCKEDFYQEKFLLENGRCKPQPTCYGPVRGRSAKVFFSANDFKEWCRNVDSCACKMKKAGNKLTKQEWSCATGFYPDQNVNGNLKCYPLPEPKKKKKNKQGKKKKNIIPNRPSDVTTGTPKRTGTERRNATIPSPAQVLIPSQQNRKDMSPQAPHLNVTGSPEKRPGISQTHERAIWLSAVVSLVIVAVIAVICFCVYVVCKKRISRYEYLWKSKSERLYNAAYTLNKELKLSLSDVEYQKFCMQMYVDITIFFESDSIARFFKSLGKILQLSNGEIERIEDANASNKDKMTAVLSQYVRSNEEGYKFMTLVRYLYIHKHKGYLVKVVNMMEEYLPEENEIEQNSNELEPLQNSGQVSGFAGNVNGRSMESVDNDDDYV